MVPIDKKTLDSNMAAKMATTFTERDLVINIKKIMRF